MNLSEFDYDLPPERIAQRPLDQRDASRMLVLGRASAAMEDRSFKEFEKLLRGDELLIVNNARVLPARLWGRRKGLNAQPVGKSNSIRSQNLTTLIEVLLLRSVDANEWEALVRPGRKISVGETIVFGNGELEAKVTSRDSYGQRTLKFSCKGDLAEAIERLGRIPLPPYIKRTDEPIDRERYQTIFARQGAAVAAPTAGLHFTPDILSRLTQRGVEIREITLDVGLGTFEPIRTEQLEDHHIHRESYEIPEDTADAINRTRGQGRPVLAVGTTVVRALEDAAQKRVERQGMTNGEFQIAPGRFEADIFLLPGKPFRIVTQLLTNFHLPRSSLLALVAAFTGRDNVLRAYRHAVEADYRFYSYGDCMWIR
ncbi:MAG TPA: tRNA preQ1(34) S-adenosylmethionine ribosyltransferase-isomerase QueA [Candidatus Acidoferrales bacterium]|nr:tRNA preQ1(34) S-adenosylmethionine ribosyltransferase-isomerase QueA [Candidatus Acidoferrales bacterium]